MSINGRCGTRDGYKRGCRCGRCRSAERVHAQGRRDRARILVANGTAPVPADRHGKVGTYTNNMCRCERCTGAMREYIRSYRSGRGGRR